ncbi:MAG: phosphoglucosamine mutase [Gemmatimonadota bacterium]
MTSSDAPLIISVSGIRGIVGQSLTDDVVRRFAAAFAGFLPAGAAVVLARDTRPSGEGFAAVVTEALVRAGCRVLNLGVCSTPGAKLMVLELEAQGAVILTASHNPHPWNGLKLIRGDGIFLNAAQAGAVEEAYHRGVDPERPGGRSEGIDPAAVSRRHLARILAAVDVDRIRGARLSAALDPCNGTGGILIPELLRELGVRSEVIHGAPDGRFAHEPEPIAANLQDLGAAVGRHGCAVGFAIDPDADRVALVSESGEAVGEDYSLALAVQSVSARRPGPVVTTLSTSQIVTDAAAAHGCPVILTPVGEVHVVEAMVAEGAAVGGEGNGGVILTAVDPGRDAAVGVAIILQALAESGRPLSRLVSQLPRYAIEKRKVSCSPAALERAVEGLRRHHPEAFTHPVQDGIKLYLSGRMECPWIHLRASNTEPVVRTIAESLSREEAEALCDEADLLLRE